MVNNWRIYLKLFANKTYTYTHTHTHEHTHTHTRTHTHEHTRTHGDTPAIAIDKNVTRGISPKNVTAFLAELFKNTCI